MPRVRPQYNTAARSPAAAPKAPVAAAPKSYAMPAKAVPKRRKRKNRNVRAQGALSPIPQPQRTM